MFDLTRCSGTGLQMWDDACVRSGLYEALSPQKFGLGEKDRLVGDAEDSRMSEYVTEEKSLIAMRRNRRGVSRSGYYRGPVGSPMTDKSQFQFGRVNNGVSDRAFGVFGKSTCENARDEIR